MTIIHIIMLLFGLVTCMYIGFLIGKRYGWYMRDNTEKAKDVLENLKKSDVLKDYNAVFYKNIKDMEFNVIGLKRKKNKSLSLKEQLQKAIMEEDYELAAQIHSEINRNKTK